MPYNTNFSGTLNTSLGPETGGLAYLTYLATYITGRPVDASLGGGIAWVVFPYSTTSGLLFAFNANGTGVAPLGVSYDMYSPDMNASYIGSINPSTYNFNTNPGLSADIPVGPGWGSTTNTTFALDYTFTVVSDVITWTPVGYSWSALGLDTGISATHSLTAALYEAPYLVLWTYNGGSYGYTPTCPFTASLSTSWVPLASTGFWTDFKMSSESA